MTEETPKKRKDAPTCSCGRACVRGRYGYFTPTCGAPECAVLGPKAERLFTVFTTGRRARNRIATTSTKTLEPDFRPGIGGTR